MQPRGDAQSGGRISANAKRGGLSEELNAHRFSAVLAPIQKPAATPPPFQSNIAVVRPVPDLPPLNQIKHILSSSSVATPSLSVNEASVNGNAPRSAETNAAASGVRRSDWRAAHAISDEVGTSLPELSALPVPVSCPLPATTGILPVLAVGSHNISGTVETPCAAGPARRTVHRVLSLREDPQSPLPSAQDRVSQPGRRIKFAIDGGNEEAHTNAELTTPLARQRNVLAPRDNVPLHSETGMYHLEYLDEGGKLQRRLTAYYHYCADQVSFDEEDAEGMFTDHLGPFLRESRQFRVYVVDDIDRAYGVVNTAVTLSAKEEQEAHPVGSATSDNGTDTVTLTGTVVNALKECGAPASSELHESYQPLQGSVFESALRKAWELREKTRAESLQVAEAGMGNSSLSGTLPQCQRGSCLPPMLASSMLAETAAAAGSPLDGGRSGLTVTDTKSNNTNGLPGYNNACNTSLPTFKAEVKASLQMDTNNDPYAPLTALQLATAELCEAELTARRVLWTSFLAESYELLVAAVELGTCEFFLKGLDGYTDSHAKTVARSSASLSCYLTFTLEHHLPWMADAYLAAYKPLSPSRPKAGRQRYVEDNSGGAIAAAAAAAVGGGNNGKPLSARKFRSVIHGEQRPLPLTAQRVLPAGVPQLPPVRSYMKHGGPFTPATAAVADQPVIFTMAFLFSFSFTILTELSMVARTQPTDIVADAMHLLLPCAGSLTRDSLFTSLTHSASVVVVSDSTTTAGQGHDMLHSTPSTGNVAASANGVLPGDAAGAAAASNGSCTADVMAATGRDSLSTASVQSRLLLRQWTQLNRVGDAPQLALDESTKGTKGLIEAKAASSGAVVPHKAARRYSSYDTSRQWLKMLFRFFRNEEAHNFMNDSPISMRNFLPLPHVSWERVLLRSHAIIAWNEFHHTVVVASDTLWGCKDRRRNSRWRHKASWDPQHWERAMRHSEQEALNMAAAMHELWYMAQEWWLRLVDAVFWVTAPIAGSKTSGGGICVDGRRRGSLSRGGCGTVDNGGGCSERTRPRVGGVSLSSLPPPAQLPPLPSSSRSPLVRQLLPSDAPGPGNRSDALPCVSASTNRRLSLQNFLRSPQEHDTSCGSPPSVTSSEVVWGSNATSASKQTGDSTLQLVLPPLNGGVGAVQVRPGLQRFGEHDTPQQLEAWSSSTSDGSALSLSSRSIMSSVSQPSPINRRRRSADNSANRAPAGAQTTHTSDGRTLAALPDVVLPRGGIVNFALQAAAAAYCCGDGDLSCNNSRLLVPAMAVVISGFYKGLPGDWELMLLVRSQSFARALWVEQERFEHEQLVQHRNRCLSTDLACAAMELMIHDEEDKWLAHRRNTARYAWDQVHMEKMIVLGQWAREREQLDFVMFATLSLESLAELQLEVLARLVEDFGVLIRETRSWVPSQTAHQRRLTTATLALGPSNSNSTVEEATEAAQRRAAEDSAKTKTNSSREKSDAASGHSFNFWGYGAFLPSANSPVGFNDGLVVMSRLCRDMRLRGRRLRTHWFVNDDDSEERGEGQVASPAFHDIRYANHDTYTGFTRVQMSDESGEDEDGGLEVDETHTPRGRTDSMTDIHREGEFGAGRMLRHGLGNYASKALGYTYVGGWYLDRPHGDGALLFNGSFPWETRTDGAKKSLFLVFGRWEHGRLAHVHLSFSGVPLC